MEKIIKQKKSRFESGNQIYLLKTNFEVAYKTREEIAEMEGVCFCFEKNRYTTEVYINEMFNHRTIIKRVVRTLRKLSK